MDWLSQRERVERYLESRSGSPALVVDVGWVNGLAAVRSLGRAGVPVLALDHRESALGFRSRYAVPVVCPDPGGDEDAFVELLAELARALPSPASVFATHDEGLSAIARRREAFGDRLLYPFPPWHTLARIQNKRYQLERAAEAGIPVPATAYPASAADAIAAGEQFGYPLLVKPSDPLGFKRRYRRQAFRCDTPAELEEAYGRAEPFEPMVQELVRGSDDALYSLGSYLARDGQPLGLFCGRKLRQTPPVVGTCRVGEAVWVDEVVEAGLRLLAALGFHGLSQVEFKRDERDGRLKLMEVNPRLWQWHGLAAACGVDLPRIAHLDLQGRRPPPAGMDGAGKRWAITLLPGETPAFARPPYVDAVFARDDLGPVVTHAARVVKGLLR